MFKSLLWEQEKENRYKAIVDLSFGAFRNHITYRVFLHKDEYWRVMVSGNFVGIVELEKSETKEEAMEKLSKRIHPGAIVLLHSTSSTNGEIIGEIIKEWKNMGYSFGQLTDL